MSLQEVLITACAVEVSGWDHNVDFFVERTWIEDEPGGRKSVALRNRLRAGTVVFVRLLDGDDDAQGFPVTYRASQVSPVNVQGLQSVSLEQMVVRKGRPEKRDEAAYLAP